MRDFSLYECVLATMKARGDVPASLGHVDMATRALPGGSTTFTGNPHSLLHWCRANERLVVDQELSDARVLAGFERLSRARAVRDRYTRLAAVAAEVVVLGEPDWEPDFPASVVPVRSGPLVREWFLVVEARRYRALLAARDLDGFGGGCRLAERSFEGVISYRRETVEAAVEALDERLETGQPA